MPFQVDGLPQEPHDEPIMVLQLVRPLVVGRLGVGLHTIVRRS